MAKDSLSASMLAAAIAIDEITPRRPTVLCGFASRDGLATGALQPLSARALALAAADGCRIVLLVLDLIAPPDGLAEILTNDLPADVELIIAATHTHAGPPVLDEALLGAPDPTYLAQLAETCAGTIACALTRLAPAGLSHRKFPAPGIAHNRRDRNGPVDHAADLVLLHDRTGTVAGAWLNFGCHPVVLGPDNLRYSPDFPGHARAALERALGVPVLYTTGCAGQINLGHSALDSIRKHGLDRRTPDEAERIGAMLAAAAIASLRTEPPLARDDATLAYARRAWPAAYLDVDAAAREAIAGAARLALADPSLTAGERRMAQIDLEWLRLRPRGAMLQVGALRAGPLRAAFLSGEVFVETSLAIQAAVPGTLVASYCYGDPGYIPHRTARGGYEVDVAWRPYGAPGPFVPSTADDVECSAIELLRAGESKR